MKTEPSSLVLSWKELDELIPEVLLVEAWAASVRTQIQAGLEKGDYNFQNARLEAKRALRKWKEEDPAKLIQMLMDALESLGKASDEDRVAPRKVASPAEAEKMLGKANFAHLMQGQIVAESSGYNLKLG